MRFIGITGGVGAGKSTILEYLDRNYHVRIMMADNIAHDLMMPGTHCHDELKEAFKEYDCFLPDGEIDKQKMAQIIFSEEKMREKMNSIVHPAVKRYIIEEYEKEKKNDKLDYLILEAALLIEEHYDEICDELWYVYTSEENRRKRLAVSRGYSKEKIDKIFQSQLSENEYRRHCVVQIDNNGSEEETIQNLRNILKERMSDERRNDK